MEEMGGKIKETNGLVGKIVGYVNEAFGLVEQWVACCKDGISRDMGGLVEKWLAKKERWVARYG